MKSILLLFLEIKDHKIREAAIPNCGLLSGHPANSLHDAIPGAFTWEDAPEGHDFWLNIFNRIKIGEDV